MYCEFDNIFFGCLIVESSLNKVEDESVKLLNCFVCIV